MSEGVIVSEERVGDGPGPEWTVPAVVCAGDIVMGTGVLLVPPGPGENVACVHLNVADAQGRALGLDIGFDELAAWVHAVQCARAHARWESPMG